MQTCTYIYIYIYVCMTYVFAYDPNEVHGHQARFKGHSILNIIELTPFGKLLKKALHGAFLKSRLFNMRAMIWRNAAVATEQGLILPKWAPDPARPH